MAPSAKPPATWRNVKDALSSFDRSGLVGLLKDLHELSPENQSFLGVRLCVAAAPLSPYKKVIERSIYPDLMKGRSVSVAKAKKAISAYRKALGSPEGVAELQVFYCEQATSFAVECGYENESYFSALIRMFEEALVSVIGLPPVVQPGFFKRLDTVRESLVEVGWGVHDTLNDLWFDLLDEEVASKR